MSNLLYQNPKYKKAIEELKECHKQELKLNNRKFRANHTILDLEIKYKRIKDNEDLKSTYDPYELF